MTAPSTGFPGATVVITHRVRPERYADYDQWLGEIVPLAKAAPGYLDWHMVKPVEGITETFTVIMRFDTPENLRAWMQSPTRARLVEKARANFAPDENFLIRSGLDFWFMPQDSRVPVAPRWKQFLITWSGIFPLVLVVSLTVLPFLQRVGLPQSRALNTLILTGTVVFLMAYVVMPRYTRLVKRWLFS